MAGLTSPQAAKAALRRELLRKRRQLPGRPEKDRAIFQVITALPQYRQARRLYLYVSTGEEPDTRRLLLAALQAGKEVYAPRCLERPGEMAFLRITGEEDLAPGKFGIYEPDPRRCPPAPEGEEGLCLVPGLAFDRSGFRLGYGKGYYDRFLAAHPHLETVGLCYGALLLPRLPAAPHDQRVRLVATEAGAIPCAAQDQRPGKERML